MFFKDIADYRKFIPANTSFDFGQIKIYLEDVDRSWFKRYLGKDLLSELQTAFNNAANFDAMADPVKELIGHLRVCSANIALAKWLPIGQVGISQMGVNIMSDDRQKTAFQWQIKDIEDSCNEIGYNALEDALEFLEENIDEAAFQSYKDSDEFKENNFLFVPSAKEFVRFFSALDSSRMNFFKLRSTIRKVEDFEIKSVLRPKLYDDLKTKLQTGETLGPLAQKLLDLIKPADVNLSIAKAINDLSCNISSKGLIVFDNTGGSTTSEGRKNLDGNALARIAHNAEKDGQAYLKILFDYLEANKDDYPFYTEDPSYSPTSEDVDLNDGSRGFFTAL